MLKFNEKELLNDVQNEVYFNTTDLDILKDCTISYMLKYPEVAGLMAEDDPFDLLDEVYEIVKFWNQKDWYVMRSKFKIEYINLLTKKHENN